MNEQQAIEQLLDLRTVVTPRKAEAIDTAVAVLKRQRPCNAEPRILTLADLQKMNGRPVWVVPNPDIYLSLNDNLLKPKYALVDGNSCYTADYSYYFDLCGTGWLAYDGPPKEC